MAHCLRAALPENSWTPRVDSDFQSCPPWLTKTLDPHPAALLRCPNPFPASRQCNLLTTSHTERLPWAATTKDTSCELVTRNISGNKKRIASFLFFLLRSHGFRLTRPLLCPLPLLVFLSPLPNGCHPTPPRGSASVKSLACCGLISNFCNPVKLCFGVGLMLCPSPAKQVVLTVLLATWTGQVPFSFSCPKLLVCNQIRHSIAKERKKGRKKEMKKQ